MGRLGYLLIPCIMAGGGMACTGGHATTQPAGIEQRQSEALKDPYGYSPFPQKDDKGNVDKDRDDRDGLQRDLDHVFNP
ncbi:MAG: hypothetical protein IT446_09190 [Phycisphaerales bacterium]|jgi:hypothetical protein|nr:hypothetical protein [Phycisphaerales bacterium]